MYKRQKGDSNPCQVFRSDLINEANLENGKRFLILWGMLVGSLPNIDYRNKRTKSYISGAVGVSSIDPQVVKFCWVYFDAKWYFVLRTLTIWAMVYAFGLSVFSANFRCLTYEVRSSTGYKIYLARTIGIILPP